MQKTVSMSLEEIVSAVHHAMVGHENYKQTAGEAGLIRALVTVVHSGPNEGSVCPKQEVAACLRIACDESDSNSQGMAKCSGLSGLLELMATGQLQAKEEAIASILNACLACSQNLEYVTEKARADLQEIMFSPQFCDEAKLYANYIHIARNITRNWHSRTLSNDDGNSLLELRSNSWCPHRTEKGTDHCFW